jgi:hypothetical protein
MFQRNRSHICFFCAQISLAENQRLFEDITERVLIEKDRERLIDEFQGALAKVKKISGFLPICASCKRIRDDQGNWNQIESYIGEHSEIDFSHGICPECAQKIYKDLNYAGSPSPSCSF